MSIRIQEMANVDTPVIPSGRSLIFVSTDTGKLTRKKDDQTFVNLEDTDVLVAISATDSTPGYLDDKITSVGRITKTILNPGANEQVQFEYQELEHFQANQTISQTPITTQTPVIFNSESQNSDNTVFVYNNLTGELTVNKNSKFKFKIKLTADTVNGTRQTSLTRFQRFNGITWVDIPNIEGQSVAYGYHRNAASGENTIGIECLLDVTSGQRFRVTVESITSDAIGTVNAGTSWIVEEE